MTVAEPGTPATGVPAARSLGEEDEARAEAWLERRLLVLAPTGRDAALSRTILSEAGVACSLCHDLTALIGALGDGAGAALLAEEALVPGEAARLVRALEAQPPWSDLPLLILTRGGADSPAARYAMEALGNVTLLERPVRIAALLSAVRSALRARGRQYQLRALLDREQAVKEELEERVRQRTAELETAYKELETFSYSVSHDLRTPLRVIDGLSQVLLEDYGDPLGETAAGYLERIRGSTQRMNRLIEDLLNLAKISRRTVRVQPLDLAALARSSFEALGRDEAGDEATLGVTFVCPETLPAEGDPGLLQILLDNLVANAWKFSHRRPEARIEVGARPGAEGTVYFVRDNGAGFDMAYADKLFMPFERLHSDREFSGTGIGLATVQRIVARHGGRVWAESEVGRGATFFFTLG